MISHYAALEFHGKAHSVHNTYTVQSAQQIRDLQFRGQHFKQMAFPRNLRETKQEHLATEMVDRQGCDIRVASMERCLVDCLDRPDLVGDWEEVWRSLESIEFFDLDLVMRYVLALGNATTAAKVGFFLDQHRDALMVPVLNSSSVPCLSVAS